jgi:hypothetical protein
MAVALEMKSAHFLWREVGRIHGGFVSGRRATRISLLASHALPSTLARMRAQFDRLHFAYQKTINDNAYIRTLKKMLERERQANALGDQA